MSSGLARPSSPVTRSWKAGLELSWNSWQSLLGVNDNRYSRLSFLAVKIESFKDAFKLEWASVKISLTISSLIAEFPKIFDAVLEAPTLVTDSSSASSSENLVVILPSCDVSEEL